MLYFLYGEDSYRAHEKLEAIKSKYIDASLGDTNLAILDAEDKVLNIDQVTRESLAFPFLARHRLVIIKNLMKGKTNKNLQTEIAELVSKIPSSTHLIIYESGLPDRRSALFKKLIKLGVSQEFKSLEGFALNNWVEQKILSFGCKIDPSATQKLVNYVGSDLWRMDNEILKLKNFNPLEISIEDVELLVEPKEASKIFTFIDYLAKRDIENVSRELNKIMARRENELYILSMIVYQFRNILIVKDLLDRNQTEREIVKISKLHPFVVQKTIPIAKKYSMLTLKKIYRNLLDYDLKIKSGKIEPKAAISMLIFEICKEG